MIAAVKTSMIQGIITLPKAWYGKQMRITTDLPPEIHSITYVKNSHWIELEDNDGKRHRVHDNGMIRYECSSKDCKFAMMTFNNHGDLTCPVCGVAKLKPVWQRMQVCFVPQKETNFHMPQRKGEDPKAKFKPAPRERKP